MKDRRFKYETLLKNLALVGAHQLSPFYQQSALPTSCRLRLIREEIREHGENHLVRDFQYKNRWIPIKQEMDEILNPRPIDFRIEA